MSRSTTTPGTQARHDRPGRDPGRPQDNVLTVPVLAILQYNGKDHSPKKVDDRFVQTEVELGVSNEKYVEVIEGHQRG